MDRALSPRTDGLAAPRSGLRLLWAIPLLGLIAWQAWMTLGLFGADSPWQGLRDQRPIVSGRHPFHFYQSYLVSRSLLERTTVCCFDPAFQAGYPKTPVFDGGDRPATLFLTLAGGSFKPAPYKIGLAVCCLLVPVCFFLAAGGLGLGPGTTCLGTAAGLLAWWASPCRQLLEAGDLDLLLAGLAVLVAAGMLVYFHRSPGFRSWTGLFLAGCLGWFAQPLLFITVVPIALVYYLSVGVRHRLAWHVALAGAFVGALVANAFWLVDWFEYWWIRSPLRADVPLLPHRTFHTLWQAPIWGTWADRVFAAGLLGAAVVGLCLFNQIGRRPAARAFGLGALGFAGLALGGLACEPLGRLDTPRLLVPALWFAALPAAHALVQFAVLLCRLADGPWRGAAVNVTVEQRREFLCRLAGGPWRGAALVGGLLAAAVGAAHRPLRTFALHYAHTTPFVLGLSQEQKAWVEVFKDYTKPEARILWEDMPEQDTDARWTALLPILTERAFLGGLDPEACIDHAYASLVAQNLAGRPIAGWSDAELSDFCRRYNVGWVVCRSPAAIARFMGWKDAQLILSMSSAAPGYLFELPNRSYVLHGQARLVEADFRHIALADVVPEDGTVVLSMHYQAGMRVSPSRVRIEKEADPNDPIDFIRLRLQGPVSRVTITWHPEK